MLFFLQALSMNADMVAFPTRHADILAKFNYDTSFLKLVFPPFVIVSIVCAMIGWGIHWIVVHKVKNNTWLRRLLKTGMCLFVCLYVFIVVFMFSNAWIARKKMHESLKTDYEVLLKEYNLLSDEVETFIKSLQEKGIKSKSSPHQRKNQLYDEKLFDEVELFINKLQTKGIISSPRRRYETSAIEKAYKYRKKFLNVPEEEAQREELYNLFFIEVESLLEIIEGNDKISRTSTSQKNHLFLKSEYKELMEKYNQLYEKVVSMEKYIDKD